MSKAKESKGFAPDIAIPPGETLKDELAAIGMTQKELARRMGVTPKTVNEIIKGKSPITYENALKLESVLGVDFRFWINLDAAYWQATARLTAQRELAREINLAKRFPYAEIAKLGWIRNTHIGIEKVAQLQSFFGVHSLKYVALPTEPAYRRSMKSAPSTESLAAWLREAELRAQKLNVSPYDRNDLLSVLDEIRRLTANMDIDFRAQATELCAGCGVAVVYLPHLRKTYINGASWYLGSEKYVIALTLRGRYDDIFWFSFFHEAGHIIKGHGRKKQFLDFESGISEIDTDDMEANRFAADFLIPPSEYEQFIRNAEFSETTIHSFARRLEISSSIVVGRLHHDEHIALNQFNHLRKRLDWPAGAQ